MSSFKLISRNDKINIYDPYADKYYVVEDDDELNKILDENGKLIPDEQIRQYFNSKESKSRKIQRGFVSKKANLKKEYADVEKQVFNDLIKYKLYQRYGPNLSNDDISAFNKNPSINTIKNFKSVRSEIKNDMQTLFKNNEAQFSQDYEDKNNLASILNELRNINQTAFDNVFNQRKIGYMTLKEDAKAAINDYDDENKLRTAINHMKNTVAQMSDVDPKIQTIVAKPKPTKEEIQRVIEIAEDKEKKLDKQAEHYDAFKYRVPDKYIKWYGDDSGVNDGKTQLSKASTIYGYNMAPVQSLYKNLAYITHDKDNFGTLNKLAVDEQPKSYNIEIDFGDNDEYQFKYTISKTSPYANEMIPSIKSMVDVQDDYDKFNDEYQKMSTSVIGYNATDSANKTTEDVDNKADFANRLKESNDYKYDDYMKNNPKKIKIVNQIADKSFSVKDFDTFNKAINTGNWFKPDSELEPEIEFDQERESHAYRPGHKYKTSASIKDTYYPIQHPLQHALEMSDSHPENHYYKFDTKELINDSAKQMIGEIGKNNEKILTEANIKPDTLKQILIGNVYQNVIKNNGKPITTITVPFSERVKTSDSKSSDSEYELKLDTTFNSSEKKDNSVFKDVVDTLYELVPKSKTNYVVKDDTYAAMTTIAKSENLKKQMAESINTLSKNVIDNLSKANYWFWSYEYVDPKNPIEVYNPDHKPTRIKPMQRSDRDGVHIKATTYYDYTKPSYPSVNVISPALNRAYKMRNVKPDSFYKGFGQTVNGFKSQAIRDLLSSRINNNK